LIAKTYLLKLFGGTEVRKPFIVRHYLKQYNLSQAVDPITLKYCDVGYDGKPQSTIITECNSQCFNHNLGKGVYFYQGRCVLACPQGWKNLEPDKTCIPSDVYIPNFPDKSPVLNLTLNEKRSGNVLEDGVTYFYSESPYTTTVYKLDGFCHPSPFQHIPQYSNFRSMKIIKLDK